MIDPQELSYWALVAMAGCLAVIAISAAALAFAWLAKAIRRAAWRNVDRRTRAFMEGNGFRQDAAGIWRKPGRHDRQHGSAAE
jgi:hypothetical protein